MKNFLRGIVGHVYDRDLFVARCESLIRQQWVVDNPGLWHRLLWIIKFKLLGVIQDVSTEHI